MRLIPYIVIVFIFASCTPHNGGTPPQKEKIDTVYTTADFRSHGDYYDTGLHVFAIDLLSDGLTYDSAFHISGTGYNLFLSDIFASADTLPAGHYTMDSTAKDMTFLHALDFDKRYTGTYLLKIQEDKIQKIILFTKGSMDIQYIDQEIQIDFSLYADSKHYQATYIGPANYRVPK